VPVESLRVILSGLIEPIRQIILAALLATLPILLLFVTGWKRWRRAIAIPVAACLIAGAFVAASLWWFQDDFLIGNMVTENGMLWEDSEALGAKPLILTPPILAALQVALALSAGLALAWLFDAWRNRSEWRPESKPLLTLLLLIAPASAAYVLAVSVRYASDELLFDRYMIFLTPLLAITLLWFYQRRIRPHPSRFAWIVLAVFAVYGVANTHDYIAAARARLQAATRLVDSGVPRDRISAGLEFDGWTQLEKTGRIPSSAERQRDTRTFALAAPYWFWRMTPAIHPAYFVVYSPIDGLRASTIPPIDFRTWLPPFHRQVLVQTARD